VLVVDGGLAAVSLAWAWVKRQVTRGSRRRWEAARSHPPGPQPQGKRGPKPTTGHRQRSLQAWAARADTRWQTVTVDWSRGQRTTRWVVSHTGWWHTPGVPPVEIRLVIVCAPDGKLRLEACCCTDRQATPGHILAGVVRRWSVEVTCEEARAHGGLETQRQGSDLAIARTTPVLLALGSRVPLLALRLSQGGPMPVETTAWYHTTEPPCVNLLGLGASSSLARPVWGELGSRASVRAMSQGGFRTLAHWPSVRSLIGQSRVEGLLLIVPDSPALQGKTTNREESVMLSCQPKHLPVSSSTPTAHVRPPLGVQHGPLLPPTRPGKRLPGNPTLLAGGQARSRRLWE
jgi:hypothetical protein